MSIYYFFLILTIMVVMVSIYYFCEKRSKKHPRHHKGHVHLREHLSNSHDKNKKYKKLRFNEISDILIYSEDDDYEKIKLKIKTKIN
jgi:hypothetical protein